MEGLLTNNIFFVYLLGILVIVNYEIFEKRQKIAIIYACSFGLMFNSDLRCIIVIALLLFILFLYEEYLNEDIIKIKYMTKIRYKILDFIYMYVIHYKLLYALVAIVLKSNVCYAFVEDALRKYNIDKSILANILIVLSVLSLIMGVHRMFNNPVELKTFNQIDQRFREYPYYQLPLSDERKREKLFEKLELVADVEDYTFFMRKKSYSSFSLEFLKIVLKKKREQNAKEVTEGGCFVWNVGLFLKVFMAVKNLFWSFVRMKHKGKVLWRLVKRFVRKILVWIRDRFKRIGRWIWSHIRGYSTIEMQLIRILAYKKGLKMGKPRNPQDVYLILTRKAFEIIYAPMFFSGHKKYINVSKERDYYRYYLVYIYLHTVQTKLNDQTFAPLDKIFGKVDVIDWPKEALFVITLGLNNMRITKNRVLTYWRIIEKYHLNLELLFQLVDCI